MCKASIILKWLKNRKKRLTLACRCDRIAKLSQRDGAEKAQKAARKREKSWRGKAAGAKRERKKSWKKMKKVLDKANSMWYNNMAVANAERSKTKKILKKSEKVLDKAKRAWYNKKARTETRRALRTLKIKQRIDKETCNSLRICLTAKYSNENEQHGYFKKKKPV